jgi:hypothetical protein
MPLYYGMPSLASVYWCNNGDEKHKYHLSVVTKINFNLKNPLKRCPGILPSVSLDSTLTMTGQESWFLVLQLCQHIKGLS